MDKSIFHSSFKFKLGQEGMVWTVSIVSFYSVTVLDLSICSNLSFFVNLVIEQKCQCSRWTTHDASNRLGAITGQEVLEMGTIIWKRREKIRRRLYQCISKIRRIGHEQPNANGMGINLIHHPAKYGSKSFIHSYQFSVHDKLNS